MGPSEPAWPAAAAWAKLKDAVGGALLEVHGLFDSCASQSDACRDTPLKNPFWIADQAAGTQLSSLFEGWTPAPSAYAIKARNAADVVAGIHFAHEKRLRLVVKGRGHSDYGASHAPDSLLLWTRSMNTVTPHDVCRGRLRRPGRTRAGGQRRCRCGLGRPLRCREAIKAKYDPDGLFFVHDGVGSDQWTADGFTRLV